MSLESIILELVASHHVRANSRKELSIINHNKTLMLKHIKELNLTIVDEYALKNGSTQFIVKIN